MATPATPSSQPITNPRPSVSLEQLQTPLLTLIISILNDTKTCSSLDPLPLVLSKQVTSNIAILLLLSICTSLPYPGHLITSGLKSIPYKNNVKNLGFHLDSTMSLDFHISQMHKSIHYHLHCFRTIRRSLPLHIDSIIASSYLLPHFDYCNNLLLTFLL